MLIRTSELKNLSLAATDGGIGRCRDFLFDDERWVVRYMEANTGTLLLGRRVLISPAALGEPDLEDHHLPVRLKRSQIESAPAIEEDEPVSRQYEVLYAQHFDYGYYWSGAGVWGAGINPDAVFSTPDSLCDGRDEILDTGGDPHLRSANELTGYVVRTREDDAGRISDLLLDTRSWSISYLVIDSRRWLPSSHTVMLPATLATTISWADQRLDLDVPKKATETAPELKEPLSRRLEDRVRGHFG